MRERWYAASKVAGVVICLSLICLISSNYGFASVKEDPIKATQTDVVPITDELLTREGETGPASPTLRMEDTSKFLTKKPYQKAEEQTDTDELKNTSSKAWDDWFSWEEGDETASDSGRD